MFEIYVLLCDKIYGNDIAIKLKVKRLLCIMKLYTFVYMI